MANHQVYPTPTFEPYAWKRFEFGDRWRFGIECHLEESELDPWGSREPYGSLWLWAAGQLIGNPWAAEQLHLGFEPLEIVSNSLGNRGASLVPGRTNLDKLDFVLWKGFREDGDFDAARWGAQDIDQLRSFDSGRFEVLPLSFSPFQDGWLALLLEDGEQETLVWQQSRGDEDETHELSLPDREFTSIIKLATDWFLPMRRARVGPDKPWSDEKPTLVPRLR